MALPATGQISLSQVQTEFGGTNPISMSEYYRGGTYVTTNNTNIPTAGVITLNSFHGAVKAFVWNYTVPNTTANFNVRNAAIAAGWDGVMPLLATVTIAAGTYVRSASTGSYAFAITGPFPSGSKIDIVNNGTMYGKGGAGGIYYTGAGGAGGPAFYCAAGTGATLRIWNNGVIAGGGGGGGASGLGWTGSCCNGRSAGGAGNGGKGRDETAAGATVVLNGSTAGAGGNWGAAGASGTWASCHSNTPNPGGAAGKATVGAANISWQATGTRYGSVT